MLIHGVTVTSFYIRRHVGGIYAIVTSVLRHKRTYGRKLLW